MCAEGDALDSVDRRYTEDHAQIGPHCNGELYAFGPPAAQFSNNAKNASSAGNLQFFSTVVSDAVH